MPATDGSSETGDPDCRTNKLLSIIANAIRTTGRLNASSFGLHDRTLKNWSKKAYDWTPPAATLENIVTSRGFRFLASNHQGWIICTWLITAARSASRCSPASDNFVLTIEFVTEALSENVWEDLPQKLAA